MLIRRAAALAALALVLLVSEARGQQPFIPPSGPLFDGSPASIGATSVQVLAAVPNGGKRQGLFIQLNTASATLTCTTTGVPAVLNTHPGITISGQGASLNFANLGAVPNTSINCIADAGSRDITILAYPQ